MATIYKFQDSETAMTIVPAPSDTLPMYSTVAVGTRQVSSTLLTMAPVTVTAATSNTTGTNFTPYGLVTITSSNNAQGYLVSPPTYAGLDLKVTVLSTSGPVVVVSGATIVTQASSTLTTMTFNGVKGSRAHLVSLSTASWLNLTTTTTGHVAWS